MRCFAEFEFILRDVALAGARGRFRYCTFITDHGQTSLNRVCYFRVFSVFLTS